MFTFFCVASKYFMKAFKGAAKLHFTHYSYVVIILFNTGLYKSAFCTDSFEKLLVCISALFTLFRIRSNLDKLYNICMINVYIAGVRYSVFLFSLHFKKRYRVISISIQTHLNKDFNKKHASRELLSY